MEMSLLLLCLITILEIVVFQQVYVNLIMDIIRLQNCAHTSDDNCDHVGARSLTFLFLQCCSVINILINTVNLVFVYVTNSRRRNKNPSPLSIFGLKLSHLRWLVTCWTGYKIIFSSLLTSSLFLSGGVHFTSIILLFTLGNAGQYNTRTKFSLSLHWLRLPCAGPVSQY